MSTEWSQTMILARHRYKFGRGSVPVHEGDSFFCPRIIRIARSHSQSRYPRTLFAIICMIFSPPAVAAAADSRRYLLHCRPPCRRRCCTSSVVVVVASSSSPRRIIAALSAVILHTARTTMLLDLRNVAARASSRRCRFAFLVTVLFFDFYSRPLVIFRSRSLSPYV